jgi:hypothetical protein
MHFRFEGSLTADSFVKIPNNINFGIMSFSNRKRVCFGSELWKISLCENFSSHYYCIQSTNKKLALLDLNLAYLCISESYT